MIKCIGCLTLRRETFFWEGRWQGLYKCRRFNDSLEVYRLETANGLLRLRLKAVETCPENPLSHCILCPETKISHYGLPEIVSVCMEHDRAWGKWLDEHPSKRKYMSSGRVKKANWVEIFREFIEDMREVKDGTRN